jgi:hypothetical protein
MISVAKQIGNAVPPTLARSVARTVQQHFWEHRWVGSIASGAQSTRQLELVG